MKTYADIIVESILGEAIVYQDRIKNPHDDRKTVVCLAPTKAEWNARFPKGAAGVLMKDGQIVIGDGTCLAHDVICHHAGLDIRNEAYRLQMSRTAVYAEIWMMDGTDFDMTPDEVKDAVVEKYGEPLEAMEAKIKAAVSRFMGDVPVRAIPLGEDQQPLIEADNAFIRAAWYKDVPVDTVYDVFKDPEANIAMSSLCKAMYAKTEPVSIYWPHPISAQAIEALKPYATFSRGKFGAVTITPTGRLKDFTFKALPKSPGGVPEPSIVRE